MHIDLPLPAFALFSTTKLTMFTPHHSYWWNMQTREVRWDPPPRQSLPTPAQLQHMQSYQAAMAASAVVGGSPAGMMQPAQQTVYSKAQSASAQIDIENSPGKIEERRQRAAEGLNKTALEQKLATIGWIGERLIPQEVLDASIKPYAMGWKKSNDEILDRFYKNSQKSLDSEKDDLENNLKDQEADLERRIAEDLKNQLAQKDIPENRKKLNDFLQKQTAVQRDQERMAQKAAIQERNLKKLKDRDAAASSSKQTPIRSRPQREVKNRLVEHQGYMVLKENQYSMAEGIKTFTGSMPGLALKDRTPLSAYNLFSREEGKLVRLTNATIEFPSLQKHISTKWREMTEEDKAPYVELARLDRADCMKEREMAMQEADAEDGAEVTGTPTRADEDGAAESEPPSASQTPKGPGADQDDEEDDAASSGTGSDEDDEDDDFAGGAFSVKRRKSQSAVSTPGPSKSPSSAAGASLYQLSGLKPPRPSVEDLCDCAIIAHGARSNVSVKLIDEWARNSPLGRRMCERLKVPYKDGLVQKAVRKMASKALYAHVPRSTDEFVFAERYCDELANALPMSRLRRMKKMARLSTATKNAAALASNAQLQQTRIQHNDEVKTSVLDSSLFRWAYMVRKYAVLEPFLSEPAKNKLQTFRTLLIENDLKELTDPKLDENEAKWAEALHSTRKTLGIQNGAVPHTLGVLEQPPSITGGHLREYQRRGLSWLVNMFENGCNSVLADEMGLGKTFQTIAFLSHLKDVMNVHGPYLVVVPLSVLTNWVNEFRRWCPQMRVVKLHSSNRDERDRVKKEVLNKFSDFDVVVTTYEMIVSSNMKNVLTSKLWWRVVVIDEGHKIKNDGTSLSQAVRSMNAQYRLLLTGTPLQNNLHELWAMLNFLDPVVFDSSAKFDEGFDLQRDVVDREKLEKAHYLLRPFVLRRTKGEVETSLPPKEEIVVNVPLSEMQSFWYKKLILNDSELLERVESSVTTSPTNQGVDDVDTPSTVNDWKRLQCLMMQLRKCCNHPFLFEGAEPDFDGTTAEDIIEASGKMKTLDLLLKKLKANGHRVVIFSQFTSMLDILSDFLQFRGYEHARLDGGTNRVQRAVDVMQYNQAGSNHFAYLMSTRAGGLGINLATADTVILYDSDWNPQVDLQAMDRVHRIGQTKPVHVYRLVSKGTIEERIVQRARKKLFLDSMVNRGSTAQGEALESLSKSEMLKMLKFGASAVFGGASSANLTDADIAKLIDRSPASMQARQAPGPSTGASSSSAATATQDNALDFDEKTVMVRLRDLYGQDYSQALPEDEKEDGPNAKRMKVGESGDAAVEAASGAKGKKAAAGRRPRDSLGESVIADDEGGVKSIAKEWKSTHEGTKSGRKLKSRYTTVDGHNVLIANNYTLQEGEKSVFSSELANRRRGPNGASLEEINRSLGRGRQQVGRDYVNEQHCLACWDGGDLILCDNCPVAAHLQCLHPDQAPARASRKIGISWRCPHHSCSVCDRKSDAAGGLLFRCTECLGAFCEDHRPMDDEIRLHNGGHCERFETLGFRKPTQGYYMLCSKSCQMFYDDRTKLGTEQAIKRAVQRQNGETPSAAPVVSTKSSSSRR